ncbi:unnamed protein product [Hymenolepis diminuta]|uniref:Uncharacterized protein n=1 Tax=Hymenolepis diminuta TaxID=6216 RepID=A0A564Z840_HYMDI|nr:unnamed protein product [Hymenolepis diminuta]
MENELRLSSETFSWWKVCEFRLFGVCTLLQPALAQFTVLFTLNKFLIRLTLVLLLNSGESYTGSVKSTANWAKAGWSRRYRDGRREVGEQRCRPRAENVACTPERGILACLRIQAFILFFGSRPGGWLFPVGLHWFSPWGGL